MTEPYGRAPDGTGPDGTGPDGTEAEGGSPYRPEPSSASPWYADGYTAAAVAPTGQVVPDQQAPLGGAPSGGPWPPADEPHGPPFPPQTPQQPAAGYQPWPVDSLGRRRRGGGRFIALTIMLSLVAGLIGGVAGSALEDAVGLPGLGPDDDERSFQQASDDSDGGSGEDRTPVEEGSVADIAARVLPSVVSIQVEAAGGAGTGSGFVIDPDGLILTNNHVIAGAAEGGDIVVEFASGSQLPAEVVGTEASYDVAVLRVDRAGLTALPFGDSDDVQVGEQVVAVGAPLGLSATVTTGIISALNRPVSAGDAANTAFINAIQTDAAINPGNSGGPLVNMQGEVVGMNSAIAQAPGGRVGGSIGLGFAIPSNQAGRTAGQLIDTGAATFPVIGVLLDSRYSGEGVKILEAADAEQADGSTPIVPGGAAEEAGIQAGDVVLAFEGRPVTAPDELIVAVRAQEPGDEVTLTVRRGERIFDATLVLQAGE